MPASAPVDLSTGAHMVADDGRPLPLLGVELRAHAHAGLARVTLRQQFQNPYDEPLRVRYLVPLPADAAVGGYVFELPGERIVGEIARKHDARERFERALIEGRSAALLEQQRSSVFDQEVGNIPPGALVTTELTIDQPLTWLGEGAWEWRFPTVVAPRYQGAPGQVPDAARQSVPVLDGKLAAGATLALTIADVARSPHSPSHALATTRSSDGWTVGIAGEAGSASLDRDIVVRWPVAAPVPGISVSLARREGDDRAMGLLTIVPPEPKAGREAVPRDLILLIDISGSMGGAPLEQAKRVIRALVSGLAERDRLEMIAFASRPIRWRNEPQTCDVAARQAAIAWVDALSASGGTNMHTAIIEALAPLRDDAQRQILLVSDGQIGFEQQIIGEAVRRLPKRSRVHCLGVGHGVNRSLTRPLARAGHGVELIVAPGEDAERVVGSLLERTVEPLLVAVELEGPAVIQDPLFPAGSRGDLFAGAPTRVALACWPEGGRLTVRARSAAGEWIEHLTIPEIPVGSGDPALIRHYARERVEDVETLIAAGMAPDGDAKIEELGLRYRIATRMTSWIAVSEQITVDPTAPTRSVEQPHELPEGMSAEGVGLRPTSSASRQRELVRNQDGVIVGAAPSPEEPKSLGFIAVPRKREEADGGAAPRGRASAHKVPIARSPASKPRPVLAAPAAARPAPAPTPAPSGKPRGADKPRDADKKKEAPKGRAPSRSFEEFDEESTGAGPIISTADERSSFGDGFDESSVDALVADDPSPEPRVSLRERISAAIRKPTKVDATIVLEDAGRLILSFRYPAKLDWTFADRLVLRVGGHTIEVQVDRSATTKPGKLGVGVTVRLALMLSAPLPPGATIEIDVCSLTLVAKR